MCTHFENSKKLHFRDLLTILFCMGFFNTIIVPYAYNQTNTVNISIAVTPPYPPKINEYISQLNKIIATLTNISAQVQNVYVSGSITGEGGIKIFTDPNFKMPHPLTLQPGMPFRMNQNNIKEVFDPDHLVIQGITVNEILFGNGLPEGIYTICLSAFDYHTGQLVSTMEPSGCSNSFTVADVELPVILQPACDQPINATFPQNVNFSWTRPPGAPLNVQYELKIIEVLPMDRNINDAVQSSSHPFFFEKTVTTNSYLFGPADPSLVTGKTYAFTVSVLDPANKVTFRNNGISEVCSFTYGKPTAISSVFYTLVQKEMIVHIEAGYLPDTDNSQYVEITLPNGEKKKVKIKDNGGVKLVFCNWIIIKELGTEKDSDGKTVTVINKYLLITKDEVDAIRLKTEAMDTLKSAADCTKSIGTAINNSLANENGSNKHERAASADLNEILKDKGLPAGAFRDNIADAKKNIDEALKKEAEAQGIKEAILKSLPVVEAERKKIIGKLVNALKLELNKEDDKEIKKEAIKELEEMQQTLKNLLDYIQKAIDIETDVLRMKGAAAKSISAALALYPDIQPSRSRKWKNGSENAQKKVDDSVPFITASIEKKADAKDGLTKLKKAIDAALVNVKEALVKEGG